MSKIQLSNPENTFFSSYYDEDLKLYEIIWHKASENMAEEEYKELMIADRDQVFRQYNVLHYILIDLTNRLDTMSPELQEWSTQNVTQFVLEKYQVLKIAIVNSKDFATQFSLEQAIEEDQVNEEMTGFFDTTTQAKEWLLGL